MGGGTVVDVDVVDVDVVGAAGSVTVVGEPSLTTSTVEGGPATGAAAGSLLSADVMTWNNATNIFGSGSGGWYPSLAMDPVHNEPAVAFYICSKRGGVAAGTCAEFEDEPEQFLAVLSELREQ